MKSSRILIVATVALLAACSQSKDGAAAKPAGETVATVNGTAISKELFEFYAKNVAGKPVAELSAEQRTQLLDNLVNGELVAQQAEKDGLDKTGDTPSILALSRVQALQQAASEAYFKDKKSTDQELRAEYDTQVAALPKLEYRARHILVASQEAAQKIIDQLKKGAKFEDLAKAQSTDTGSGAKGGELGWFSPNNMVKPFADALVTLKKGEITQAPVQSQYGWHVIQLEETRDYTPPPFDSVKDRVEQIVQQKKWKAYVEQLTKTAKIEKKAS
ncbi:MAG: peptidylprolyl isomerase [Steroidobacteraceae bacterium]